MSDRLLLATLLATTTMISACSQQPAKDRGQSEAVTSADIVEAPTGGEAAPSAMRVPGISPHAAPGVAFSYRYAFVLPDETISAVQEQHASACEKLGVTRCRITGMRYTLVDEDTVHAQLQFKLSPELARNFGKEGIAAVEKAQGKLVDAAIEGEDVGARITDLQRRSANVQAELSRLEARLNGGGIGDRERAELRAQVERLRAQLSGERDSRTAGEEQLATTPMIYTYRGSDGFSLGANPFGDAAEGAWGSFVTLGSFLLLAIGVVLPWALAGALGWWLWRRWRPAKRTGAGATAQD